MRTDNLPTGRANASALLRKCLRLSDTVDATVALRNLLWTSRYPWETLYELSAQTRLAPALYWRLKERGLLPPVPRVGQTQTAMPGEILEGMFATNQERHANLGADLLEIVSLLNSYNLQPILIKGARHLWLEDVPWRSLRDLDLLLPGKQAETAQAALINSGYLPDKAQRDRPNRHHLAPLFRDDLAGWLEIHRRAGNPYAEQFCPTSHLVAGSRPVTKDGCTALILAEHHHVWHGVLHHHFGHSGFARGHLELKGLFEFAALFATLADEERAALLSDASQTALGLATLELWLALAEAEYGLAPDHKITISHDARQFAKTWIARSDGQIPNSVKYPGYRDMMAMGWNMRRCSRVKEHTGSSLFGTALAVPAMLAPKLIRN